ncbi:NAD(P)-dependent oxidoreductase [Ruthenibacterium sp. CLA-JM-H11]|uniref:NAD(P)-dependent oxidoreductase n=1 Tax=Ruthenibacterium intestinale TaxID=3133163 RepID=A0ABV1GDE3_9FIRM
MKKVGFIGLGVMGTAMAQNLLKAGFEVFVWARHPEKAQATLDKGAHWCDTLADCARGRDAVITMVGFPQDVREVYFSEGGILDNADKGTLLIDMTTTSPRLSVEIHTAAIQKGLRAVDAPVSGGDAGARNATLSIMMGGDKADCEACMPLFEAMGKTIVYEGPAGSGQHTKAANQIALGGAIAGVCEAISYAKAAGLDVQTMLNSISQGAAGSWQMSNTAPRMLKGDFAPGFYVKHYVKDCNIALEEAGERALSLPVLQTVRDMYAQLEADGLGDDGTQTLIHYYEKK